jgi:serine protease
LALSFLGLLTACDVPTAVESESISFPGAVYPTDSLYQELQWQYEAIQAPEAWGIVESSDYSGDFSEVVVAVLDSGVLGTHQDLEQNLLFDPVDAGRGYDFVSATQSGDGDGYDPDPTDPGGTYFCNGSSVQTSWHGTHVTGSVAAEHDNVGVVGTGASLITVLPIRGLTDCGGLLTDISNGIRYAADTADELGLSPQRRAQVINMSLGGSFDDPNMYDSVQGAVDKGISVVAASGNTGSEQLIYPAAFDNVIAVGAVDGADTRASYSNWGSALDFVAPGGAADGPPGDPCGPIDACIASTSGPDDDTYAYQAGTSQATPHVAGVIGLLYAYEPNLTQSEVYTILMETAKDLGEPGWDPEYGHGLVQAGEALKYLINVLEGQPIQPMGGGAEPQQSEGGAGIGSIPNGQPQGGRPPQQGAILPPAEPDAYDSTTVIIRISDAAASEAGGADAVASRLVAEYGLAGADGAGTIRTVELASGQSPAEVIQALAADPAVQYAQPNYRYQLIR